MTSQSDYLSYLPKIKDRWPETVVRTNPGRKNYRPLYGYSQHPKDKQLFVANYEKLFALERALEYIVEGVSYRDAAEWVRQTTGEYVSHVYLYYEHRRRKLKYIKARKGIRKQISKERQKELLNGA